MSDEVRTFFNLNRIFLLGVLILSALLPFISIEINRNDMIGFPTLASVSELLEENQIGKSSQSTLITATEQPIPMIPLLYGIGVVFFLTSSLRTPKFFVKEFSYFLMPCHQHGLRINLLVQR